MFEATLHKGWLRQGWICYNYWQTERARGTLKRLGSLQSSTLTDNVTLTYPPDPIPSPYYRLFFSLEGTGCTVTSRNEISRTGRPHGSHHHFLAWFTIISLSDIIGWIRGHSPSFFFRSPLRGWAHEQWNSRRIVPWRLNCDSNRRMARVCAQRSVSTWL